MRLHLRATFFIVDKRDGSAREALREKSMENRYRYYTSVQVSSISYTSNDDFSSSFCSLVCISVLFFLLFFFWKRIAKDCKRLKSVESMMMLLRRGNDDTWNLIIIEIIRGRQNSIME